MKAVAILLGFTLLCPGWASKQTTQIGLTTGERSWSVRVPLNDCHDLDEEEISSVFLSKKCMAFTGPSCIGTVTQLMPGEHSSNDPVPLGSVYCLS